MKPPNRPTLSINVSASLRSSNGVDIRITEQSVHLSKPGPNGGKGDSVAIALADWDAVHETVQAVRSAIRRASDAVADVAKA